MRFAGNYINKVRFTSMAVWFAFLFALLIGFRYLKELVLYILTKLYDFFIQQSA